MAQPVHVQQLLKLKQQAVQQQKAIQPQVAQGQAAVQQKVLGSLWWVSVYHRVGPPKEADGFEGEQAEAAAWEKGQGCLRMWGLEPGCRRGIGWQESQVGEEQG